MKTMKEAAQSSVRATIGKSLIVKTPQYTDTQVFIAERPIHAFLIGRLNACDVQLKDGTISRIQYRVVYTGRGGDV